MAKMQILTILRIDQMAIIISVMGINQKSTEKLAKWAKLELNQTIG